MTYSTMHRFTVSAALLAVTITAEASLINWAPARDISSAADVSTDGELIGAFNIGGSTVPATVVNGVAFQPLFVNGTTTSGNFTVNAPGWVGFTDAFGSSLPRFSDLDAGYQTLLRSGMEPLSGSSFSLEISGLEVGQAYVFQYWTNVSSSLLPLPGQTITAEAGASVSTLMNTTGAVGGVGQYGVGGFIASASDLVIDFSAGAPGGWGVVNGFQLRKGIPEPGTALGSCAALLVGLGGRARRLRRSPGVGGRLGS